MKRLIVDFSNLLWTSLLVGKDGENGKKIQHNGKEIYINSALGVDIQQFSEDEEARLMAGLREALEPC